MVIMLLCAVITKSSSSLSKNSRFKYKKLEPRMHGARRRHSANSYHSNTIYSEQWNPDFGTAIKRDCHFGFVYIWASAVRAAQLLLQFKIHMRQKNRQSARCSDSIVFGSILGGSIKCVHCEIHLHALCVYVCVLFRRQGFSGNSPEYRIAISSRDTFFPY